MMDLEDIVGGGLTCGQTGMEADSNPVAMMFCFIQRLGAGSSDFHIFISLNIEPTSELTLRNRVKHPRHISGKYPRHISEQTPLN